VSVAGAAVLVVGGVAAAQSSVRSGTYKGRTDKGTPIAFRVSDKGTRISRFRFSGVRLRCSDGVSFRVSGQLSSGREKLVVSPSGRFTVKVRYRDGGRWDVRGRIRGGRASGALRMRVRFNADNEATPDGPIRCDSGRRKFKVRGGSRRRRPEPTFTGKR
jgi:hypothetical protein